MIRHLLIVILLGITIAPARADFVPTIDRSWNIARTVREPVREEWHQAETVRRQWTFDFDGAPVQFPTNAIVTWDVVASANEQIAYIAHTGTIVDAESGVVFFELTPEESNLVAGQYRGYINAWAVDGETAELITRLQRQAITVVFSTDSRFYDFVGPLTYAVQTGAIEDGAITPAKLDRAYVEADDQAYLDTVSLAGSAVQGAPWEAEGYLTDYTVTEEDVTTHQSALVIHENQIADLQHYLTGVVARTSGGPFNPDWFTISTAPFGYSVSSVVSTTTHNSVVTRTVLTENETGRIIDASVLRQSDPETVIAYTAISNVTLDTAWIPYGTWPVLSNLQTVALWDEGMEIGDVGVVRAVLGEFERIYEIEYEGPASTNQFVEYVADVPGSLRHVINTSILARAAADPLDMEVYTDQWTRNTNVWTGEIDLTCVSPWNSRQGTQRAGTLITPQHIALAAHFPLAIGDTLKFVDNDNEVYERTVADRRFLDHDVLIARLDAALPASITPAKVLDQFGTVRLWGYPHQLQGSFIYAVWLNRHNRAVLGPVRSPASSWTSDYPITMPWAGAPWPSVGVGDSGSPILLHIEGQTVLLGTWWTSFGGTSISYAIPAIEAAIADMGASDHLSLDRIDLDHWYDYSLPPIP